MAILGQTKGISGVITCLWWQSEQTLEEVLELYLPTYSLSENDLETFFAVEGHVLRPDWSKP